MAELQDRHFAHSHSHHSTEWNSHVENGTETLEKVCSLTLVVKARTGLWEVVLPPCWGVTASPGTEPIQLFKWGISSSSNGDSPLPGDKPVQGDHLYSHFLPADIPGEFLQCPSQARTTFHMNLALLVQFWRENQSEICSNKARKGTEAQDRKSQVEFLELELGCGQGSSQAMGNAVGEVKKKKRMMKKQ